MPTAPNKSGWKETRLKPADSNTFSASSGVKKRVADSAKYWYAPLLPESQYPTLKANQRRYR